MIVCPFKDIGRYAAVIPGLEEALRVIEGLTDLEPRTIPLSGNNRIIIQNYNTRSTYDDCFEAHRKFLDLQYILEGEECVAWADLAALVLKDAFSEAGDIGFYTGHGDLVRIPAGYCYVVFPEDAHAPSVAVNQPMACKKMVVKLAV